MSSRISPLCELNFIKNLSKDLIKFVYYPLGQNFENDFSHFHIIKEKRKFKKHIYKMICQETNKIIMYFVETSSFCSKKKTISIYLNYTYINLQYHLISDLVNLVNEFVGINFNNTAKNGILIGVVEADYMFEKFTLVTNVSKLCKILKRKTLFLATQTPKNENENLSIKQWLKNFVQDNIKQTSVVLNTMNTNDIINVQNKIPIWNNVVHAYVLNFHGLVKKASVKNTILLDDNENELFIFGKISKNLYSLNVKSPMSLIQSICMAITCIYK
jgi:hypothetical protein